ncbi:hypothetical protein K439DRAFT_1648550 [Ramaria rubella]|nr:hypothetical protein K439DRAFT_1648550 [Ramaria rubella]
MCLLDLLDNLPHLWLSCRHMEMMLWVMEMVGGQNVPSLYALRTAQEHLRTNGPVIATNRYVTASRNILYMNDIPSLDYSNPQVASLLHVYPEETDGLVTEFWQAARLKQMPPDLLSPMFRKGLKDYYVNKLAEMRDGSLVIPHMWIIREGRMCADAYNVVTIGFAMRMPNPLRQIAQGEELYMSFLTTWADDVGGNVSKLVNAFKNLYFRHVNLPGHLLQQEFFMCMVATSQHASTPEQFEAVHSVIRESHVNPIRTYYAHTHHLCRFRITIPGLPADNPQQSEEANHIGPSGNCKCRQCLVGGTLDIMESDEGYHTLHLVSRTPHTVDDTKLKIREQIEKAVEGRLGPVTTMQTLTGVKDKVAQVWILRIIQQEKNIKQANPSLTTKQVQEETIKWLDSQPGDLWSPLLDFAGPPGLDPHSDMPVEILHTILLGIIKYVWPNLHTTLDDNSRELFVTWLQSSNISGLSILPVRAAYMSQYRNRIISKHFKTIMQTIVFHMHRLVQDSQFELIKATGCLGALVWYHEIPDMHEYLDLRILIANVLDAFNVVNPACIITKAKIHVLVHLPEDIERFGPAIRFVTEVFECFNHIFCMCSVLSNHQAPGRDIAQKCVSMERVKHIASGGFWKGKHGEYMQASVRVQEIIKRHPIIQSHLGWVVMGEVMPGTAMKTPKSKQKMVLWSESCMPHCVLAKNYPHESAWMLSTSVTSSSGDICPLQSWVIGTGFNKGSLIIGKIHQILIPSSPKFSEHVVVNCFLLGSGLHPAFDMPALVRDSPIPVLICLSPKDICFIINVQHDCHTGGCVPNGTRHLIQERETTTCTVETLNHDDNQFYVINLTALHNAALLHQALPHQLTEPRPLHEDRRSFHDALAASLRVSLPKKREVSKAKAKLTWAANKAKKQASAMGPTYRDEDHVPQGDSGDDSGKSDGPHDTAIEGGSQSANKKRRF